MKKAIDYRRLATDALEGKWTIAVIAGLIASILTTFTEGPKVSFNFNTTTGANVAVTYANREIFSTAEGLSPQLQTFVVSAALYVIVAAIAMGIVLFILGSVIRVGYSGFNLNLVDGDAEPELNTLFAYLNDWKTTAMTHLLQAVYIFLWSLLLVVPGIMASFSYAMTGYVLAEHPELTPKEALQRSKDMMEGNRWRLFCLRISFIGWMLLASLTLGIGGLWLTPYMRAADAAFYRDISGTGNRTYTLMDDIRPL